GESLMVARDVDLAGDTGRPVHLMHLSARESVDHLRRAQGLGFGATGEVTPHHLCLTDEAVRTLDPNVKMNPPLRTEDDRAALGPGPPAAPLNAAPGAARTAAPAPAHAPPPGGEKGFPSEPAPWGVVGLERAFSALYPSLVERGVLTLEPLLGRMSAAPAAIF